MKDDKNLFYELTYYTLAHPDQVYFIHQHAVDAYTAQQANDSTKPIAITFALAGLYLFLERKYTGRQVQKAHMEMANQKRTWPTFELPLQRGEITVQTVLASLPGNDRDAMIATWCISVWQTWSKNHDSVRALVGSILNLEA